MRLIAFVLFFAGLFWGLERGTTPDFETWEGGYALAAPSPPALSNRGEIDTSRYTIVKQAPADITVRLLWIGHHQLASRANVEDLSPLQAIVGWGPMSIDANLEAVKFPRTLPQNFNVSLACQGPVTPQMAIDNTQLTYLRGDSAATLRSLKRLNAGQAVRLRGWYIDAIEKEYGQSKMQGFNRPGQTWGGGGGVMLLVEGVETL